jgi:hypothetical protein
VQLPLPFVINERSGKAYWDNTQAIDDYRTLKLSEARVIIEWDFDPGDDPDPEEVGYDLNKFSIDRLSGGTILSQWAKDGSKDRRIIDTGSCREQRPKF